jgi:DNA-binding IclR family transcriptional regulator
VWHLLVVADDQSSSLRKALDLIDALASGEAVAEDGWGVNRVAASLGRDKSQVSRTLRTLAEAGYVERDPESLRYRIGWHVFALAARSGDQRLLTAAVPILRRLAAQDLGERIHLTVLRGNEVLTVLTQASSHSVESVAWAGRMVPAFSTSSGRALLIDLDRHELAQLFDGVAFVGGGPNAPRDIQALFDRILVARSAGYAITDEEFEPGLVAASAPVRGSRGEVIAALNVSGPKFRLGDRLPFAGQAIRAAAAELSAQQGWDGREPYALRYSEDLASNAAVAASRAPQEVAR